MAKGDNNNENESTHSHDASHTAHLAVFFDLVESLVSRLRVSDIALVRLCT